MPPDLSPMLAERGLPSGCLDRWAVEPKLDGWRVTVLVDERVVVRTRRGHAITDTVPGINALAGILGQSARPMSDTAKGPAVRGWARSTATSGATPGASTVTGKGKCPFREDGGGQ